MRFPASNLCLHRSPSSEPWPSRSDRRTSRAERGRAIRGRVRRPPGRLIGTWEFAGEPGKVVGPKPGGPLISLTGTTHFAITEYDPATGKVVTHHGGTYTFDGNEYVETVRFGTPNRAPIINKSFKFKIKFEGDTFTQTGIDNDFKEVWKRVK